MDIGRKEVLGIKRKKESKRKMNKRKIEGEGNIRKKGEKGGRERNQWKGKK